MRGLSIKATLRVGPYILLTAFILSLFSLTILQEEVQIPTILKEKAENIVINETKPNVLLEAYPNVAYFIPPISRYWLAWLAYLSQYAEENITKKVNPLCYWYFHLKLPTTLTSNPSKNTIDLLLVPAVFNFFSKVMNVEIPKRGVLVNNYTTLNKTHILYVYYVGKTPSKKLFAIYPVCSNESRNLWIEVVGRIKYNGIGESWTDPLYPKGWGTTTVYIAFIPSYTRYFRFHQLLIRILSFHLKSTLLPGLISVEYAVSFNKLGHIEEKVKEIKSIILSTKVPIKLYGGTIPFSFSHVKVGGRYYKVRQILNLNQDLQILYSYHWQYFLFYAIGILYFSAETYRRAISRIKSSWRIIENKGRKVTSMKATFYSFALILAALFPAIFYQIVSSFPFASLKISFVEYYAISVAVLGLFFVIYPFLRERGGRLRYFFIGALFVMISASYIFSNWGSYGNVLKMLYGIMMIIIVGGILSILSEADFLVISKILKRDPKSFMERGFGYYSIRGMAILVALITSVAMVNFPSFAYDLAVKTKAPYMSNYITYFVISSIPHLMNYEWWIPLLIVTGISFMIATSEIIRIKNSTHIAICKGISEKELLRKTLKDALGFKVLRFYVLYILFLFAYLLIWDFIIWESHYLYVKFGERIISYFPPRLITYLSLNHEGLFLSLLPVWIIPILAFLYIKFKYRRELNERRGGKAK